MHTLCENLVNTAILHGAQAADAICVQVKGVEASVFEGEVDKFTNSHSRGAGLRVMLDGRVGYAYTEKPEEIEGTVQAALQSARISDQQEGLDIYRGPAAQGSAQEKQTDEAQAVREMALALYRASEEQGAQSVQACEAQSEVSTVWFCNSAGVSGVNIQKSAALFVEPVYHNGDFTDSNYAFACGESIEELNEKAVAKTAMERARQYEHPKPGKSGAMPVVIKAQAMADLLDAFSPLFSGENAQKGLSLLKDKEGQTIASELITLIDSPRHPQLDTYFAFDGEGVPTKEKKLIDGGTLTTLLYDIASANRKGVQSTGNARRGYQTPVSIAPYHLYFAAGETSEQALWEGAKDGVVVAEVSGLHAGVNATSGDFSLLAKGFHLKDGQLGAPIEQMVVSGNFYALIKDVKAVGDDVVFSMPSSSTYGSPAMLFERLSIATADE